jgi:riboflavin kinase/FMN adenylyltransferase
VFTLSNFDPIPESLRGAVLAIGNFDGVHRGHTELIRRLRACADRLGTNALAVSFDPRPVDVLRPNQAPPPLTWASRKVELLLQAGAHHVGVFQTGAWLLSLTAREFFERVVLKQFGAIGMVEGPTFGFGRDRGGDTRILAGWCAESGLDFNLVDAAELDGALVSTTRIRQALAEGRVADAAKWLGRPHRIRGMVVRGAGRGAGLGFPTANLAEIEVAIPADGVYAGRALLAGRSQICQAAIHIGPNATFHEWNKSIEAHILDFNTSIYDQIIELELIERIRPSVGFTTVEALLDQIHDDVRQTRAIFARE